MRLWTMDAWVGDRAVLTNRHRLRAIMRTAARAGGMTVLGEKFCVFDNAAVTGVLVLAQSHLSIHTWPEVALANVDLLAYGDGSGDATLRLIGSELGAEHVNVACMSRGRR
jgi:S-adenosylmethionine decarboxylase